MLHQKNGGIHYEFKDGDLFELLFLASVGCNLRCEFCCEQGKERNIPEGQAIENVLAVGKALGIKLIDINGGEPLLVGETSIKNMIQTFIFNGFDVSISSNSYLLTDSLIDYCSDKLSIFNISLHAFSNDLNDKIMGRAGVSDIIKNNIKKLVASRIPVHVTCVVINENIDEVMSLAKWCNDEGVSTLCLNRVFGRGKGSEVLKEKQPDISGLNSLLLGLKKNIGEKNLHMYINYSHISHIGQCVLLRPDGSLTGAPRDPRSSQDGLIPIGHAFDSNLLQEWDDYEFKTNHYKYCYDKFSLYR